MLHAKERSNTKQTLFQLPTRLALCHLPAQTKFYGKLEDNLRKSFGNLAAGWQMTILLRYSESHLKIRFRIKKRANRAMTKDKCTMMTNTT